MIYSQAPVLRNIVQVEGEIGQTPNLINTSDGNFLFAAIKLQEIGDNIIELRKFDALGNTIWKVFLDDLNPTFFNQPELVEVSSGYIVGIGSTDGAKVRKVNKFDGDVVLSTTLNTDLNYWYFKSYLSDNIIFSSETGLKVYSGDFALVNEIDISAYFGGLNYKPEILKVNENQEVYIIGLVYNEISGCFISNVEIGVLDADIFCFKFSSNLEFLDLKTIEYDSDETVLFNSIDFTDSGSAEIYENGEIIIGLQSRATDNLPCASEVDAPIHKFDNNLNIDPSWNSNPTNFGTFTGFDDIGFFAYDAFEGKPLVVSLNSLVEINDNGTKGWETDFIGERGVGFGSQTERVVSNGNGLYVTLQRDFQFFEGSPDFLSIAFLEAPIQATGDLIQ